MNLLFVLLQNTVATTANSPVVEESYFSLLQKGGLILIPIALLFVLAVYIIIERSVIILRSNKKDKVWLSRVTELIEEGKIDKASLFCASIDNSSARVIKGGLDEIEHDVDEIQETMQAEAGLEINRLETRMNYLGITSSIAPMLGFLGTIFGVIKIFYNISVTNDLNIANIADGLYQKMICSGAGLFVGIIAYAGYYALNGRIDSAVNQMNKDTNEIVKCIRKFKKNPAIAIKKKAVINDED